MNFIFQLTFDLKTAHRYLFSICAIRVICEPLISLADLANPADFLPTDLYFAHRCTLMSTDFFEHASVLRSSGVLLASLVEVIAKRLPEQEIIQIYTNLSTCISAPICWICTDLLDFSPRGRLIFYSCNSCAAFLRSVGAQALRGGLCKRFAVTFHLLFRDFRDFRCFIF